MACVYPTSIGEALGALAAIPGAVPVAGCTDFYPSLGQRPLRHGIVDLSGVRDASGIEDAGDHFRIGALTTWSEVIAADLPPAFDGLKAAARQVGGVQVQNAGTLGGNLCNASPAADGVPPLLSLDAKVELRALAGTRRLTLSDFLLGNRRTCRRADEILAAILVPKRAGPASAIFLKLGARAYLVISIAMVAAVIERDNRGAVARAGIAVGACSAVAQRLHDLEQALVGCRLGPDLARIVTPAHLAPLSPIGDLRGSADYRLDAVLTLVRRALLALTGTIPAEGPHP